MVKEQFVQERPCFCLQSSKPPRKPQSMLACGCPSETLKLGDMASMLADIAACKTGALGKADIPRRSRRAMLLSWSSATSRILLRRFVGSNSYLFGNQRPSICSLETEHLAMLWLHVGCHHHQAKMKRKVPVDSAASPHLHRRCGFAMFAWNLRQSWLRSWIAMQSSLTKWVQQTRLRTLK